MGKDSLLTPMAACSAEESRPAPWIVISEQLNDTPSVKSGGKGGLLKTPFKNTEKEESE